MSDKLEQNKFLAEWLGWKFKVCIKKGIYKDEIIYDKGENKG